MRFLPSTFLPRRETPPMRLSRGDVRLLRKRLAAEASVDHLRLAAVPDVFERRDDGRREVGGVAVELRRIGPGRMGPALDGRLRDVSREGLAIASPLGIEAGERLRVAIAVGGARELEVLCTCRWSRPDRAAWVVGCEAGVTWCDSLCDLVLPPDAPVRRVA